MIEIELRKYQTGLIDNIRKSLIKGNKSVVAVLGCGGGKSVIQGTITKQANDKGNRVLFLVHRKELCEQIKQTFTLCGVNWKLTSVEMVQTVSRRLKNIPTPQLIITDECHHSTAKTYTKIYDYFPNAVRLGFTATPCRLNQGGLGQVYSDMVTSVSTQWLIENNYLSPYKYYSVSLADTSKLHTRAGDFVQEEVEQLLDTKEIYGETVKQWEKIAKGKKTIVYCSSIELSKSTAKAFEDAGYISYSLDGNTPKNKRISVMERFRNGEVTILCNMDLFGEGLDVPDCECVVLLRPTQSLSLYIQQSMRSMRYRPNKVALIIDHVGNVYRHGLPDDNRKWSLESKKKQENMVKIRECKNCFAVYSPKLNKCPYCQAEATHEVRNVDKKVIELDLQEIKRKTDIKNTRLADAELKTWQEITEFQKIKGYKFAWCLRYAKNHDIPIPNKYGYMCHLLGI